MASGERAEAFGLDDVVVARTAISEVDGERGRLTVAGHDVEALAGHVPFEAVCHLLWSGALPPASELDALRRRLGGARARAFERVAELGPALERADGMDALRASVAQLGPFVDEEHVELTAAVAVFAAAWCRRRDGGTALPPDPEAPHAADYLRMCTGSDDRDRAAAVDAYLCTVADHGMNASTFTARVVASTGSDMVSAVVAAVGALKGPLHGGAPGPVLDMLDAIGEPARAEGWLEGELAAGRRIMGMGHRVYRVRDPRAAVLERAVERLERAGRAGGRLELARAVERAADGILASRYPARSLRANVEFYTAVLLDAAGLPREAFSPTFAAGRVAGWTAHVAEQRATGRLIRPASDYVGPAASAAAG